MAVEEDHLHAQGVKPQLSLPAASASIFSSIVSILLLSHYITTVSGHINLLLPGRRRLQIN